MSENRKEPPLSPDECEHDGTVEYHHYCPWCGDRLTDGDST